MAYRAFLDPNKPCFLIGLYLLPIENLHNDRTLFDVGRGKGQVNKDTIANQELSYPYCGAYYLLIFSVVWNIVAIFHSELNIYFH